ncbi:D-alanyl-D-alanine carboxypeptidase, partial [Streptomyces sp. SID6013]|nr:D-alanyl-D-alanine carboxypeptidase [Streptomyces sp. SID6013]
AAAAAAKPAEDEPGWPETGAILGVAALGAGVTALALRLKLVRDDGS